MDDKPVNYENHIIKEIDEMYGDSNYLGLADAANQIKKELKLFEAGKLTDEIYKQQLKEALEFVERRKARIPYEGC